MANYQTDETERDKTGQFIKTPADEKGVAGIPPLFAASQTKTKTTGTEPPLISLQVTNPVTYLRIWWKKVISGEGVDIRLHIHPLTAFGFVLAIALGSFGAGRLSISDKPPIIRYEPLPTPTPTPVPIRPAAYAGNLLYDNLTGTYYLLTNFGEAITLSVLPAVNLQTSVGKRVLAAGLYNPVSGILVVNNISNLEVLPLKPVTLPVVSPSPMAVPEPSIRPTM
jgi:hypothetical protein